MDSFKLTNYKLLKLIGSGNFGEVFKIQDKTTGKIYAAKISTMTFDESKDDFRKNFEREVSIISKVHHPSILKFIGLSLTNFKRKQASYCYRLSAKWIVGRYFKIIPKRMLSRAME